MSLRFLLLINLWLLSTCPIMGQVTSKKHLTVADYEQWGTLTIKSISEQGGWTSYEMNYDAKNDTLFLQNTRSKVRYAYPKGRDGYFEGERIFAYLNGDDLTLVDLPKVRTKVVKDVKQFEFLKRGKYLITLHQDNTLQVRNAQGEVIDSIAKVTDYQLSPQRNALVYHCITTNGYAVGCLEFDRYKHTIVTTGQFAFEGFTWQLKGQSVVFFNGVELFYYRMADRWLSHFDVASLKGYDDVAIVKSGLTGFRISNDGTKVFFSVAVPNSRFPRKASEMVEIWNGNDACLYPTSKEIASRDTPKLAVWFLANGMGTVLSDDYLYRVRLTGESGYVLLSNPHSYGLEPDYYEKVDYYIKNVATGAEKMLLQQQSHDPNMLCVSPLDNRLVYYRDKNWWLYNPDDDSLRNLTAHVNTAWDNTSDDAPNQFKVHGLAGWSSDGKSILLYDQYDIWQFALDGSGYTRLTYGSATKKVFRINHNAYKKFPSRAYDSGLLTLLDIKEPILLECRDDKQYSGYAIYHQNAPLKMLVFDNCYFDQIKQGSNGNYVYRSQTFSQSPQVVFLNRERISQLLFQSNKQQVNFHYGHSELISYTNSEGKSLSGVLFYPADYDEKKSYPMVVLVYEKMSYQLHRYVNPSHLNPQGFSVTNFTLNGYFVLMPDIAYQLGNPMVSATDCIVKAVRKVLDTRNVNPAKVGLIGHSFGGYETNFAITQTGIFAAAVSGAGVSDVVRHYFELHTNGSLGRDGMWRYEKQQFRLGDSFFNAKQAYFENSALAQADKITTPLLQWVGRQDNVIPYEQSIALYLALRRLRLPTILLVYPDEEHNIRKKENQRDLTHRIQQWFDFYLKDKKEVGWIKSGTTAL